MDAVSTAYQYKNETKPKKAKSSKCFSLSFFKLSCPAERKERNVKCPAVVIRALLKGTTVSSRFTQSIALK